MIKKANKQQLSLLEQFDKTKNRQELLVTELIKTIGNIKYFRTCTQFAFIDKVTKETRLSLIEGILYWMAQLAIKQAKGLEKYKDKNYAYFHGLTKDGTFLHMTESVTEETLVEWYQSGSRRARTLLIASRDLIKHDLTISGRIIENFDKLIRT